MHVVQNVFSYKKNCQSGTLLLTPHYLPSSVIPRGGSGRDEGKKGTLRIPEKARLINADQE